MEWLLWDIGGFGWRSRAGYALLLPKPTQDMCTLLAWKGIHRLYPLILAANRDEFEGRPSSGPQALSTDPLVVGGRDDVAGGTWLALSERGIVVGVANRRAAGAHDPSRRSRGRLPLDLARAPSLDDLRAALEQVDPSAYNPFILLAGDARAAVVAHGGKDGLRLIDPSKGAHAITNWDLDADKPAKAARAKRAAQTFDVAAWDDADQLAARLHDLLRDHAPGPDGNDGGLCVHRPEQRYGTRSSSVILLSESPVRSRFFHAEGHACESVLQDVSHLLTAGARPAATAAAVPPIHRIRG